MTSSNSSISARLYSTKQISINKGILACSGATVTNSRPIGPMPRTFGRQFFR